MPDNEEQKPAVQPVNDAPSSNAAFNDDLDETTPAHQRDVHTDGELLVDSVVAEAGYVHIRAHYEKSGEAVDVAISIEEALHRYVGLGVAYKLKAEKASSGMWADSRQRLLRTIRLLEKAVKEALIQRDQQAANGPKIIVPGVDTSPGKSALIIT